MAAGTPPAGIRLIRQKSGDRMDPQLSSEHRDTIISMWVYTEHAGWGGVDFLDKTKVGEKNDTFLLGERMEDVDVKSGFRILRRTRSSFPIPKH